MSAFAFEVSPPPRREIHELDDDELRERLLAGRFAGDPLADELVAAFHELPGGAGWRLFERALANGLESVPEAPDPLRALVEQASDVPPSVDLELVRAGAISFWRIGLPALAVSMTYGSLAFGYQYADLSRPLAATGRLERMASRRLGETTRWLLAVTTPGAMAPGREGWKSSLRVRLVHALVRDRLSRSPDWDGARWGVPLSATALMATAVGGFDVIPDRALRDLGARSTAAEREARTALWRWVAHVMGVPSELLPANRAEADRLISVLETCFPGAEDDGVALMHALTHHGLPLEGLLPGPAVGPARALAAPVLEALVRRWLGDDMGDTLGLGRTPLRRLVPLVRPVVRGHATLLATGLIRGEERTARAQIALLHHLMDRAGDPVAPISLSEAGGASAPRAT